MLGQDSALSTAGCGPVTKRGFIRYRKGGPYCVSFPLPGYYEEVVWIPKGSVHVFIQDLNLSLSHLGEQGTGEGGRSGEVREQLYRLVPKPPKTNTKCSLQP